MNSDNVKGKCCKCPAKMSDGRLFTNFLLNSKLNASIKESNNITDEHEYRNFLQVNGSKIMDEEKASLNNNKKCNFDVVDATQ